MSAGSELITTTTDVIQGFRIKKFLGVVRGTAEDDSSPRRSERIKSEYYDYRTDTFVEDRRDKWEKAHDSMRSCAERMKANAVIGVTYACYPVVSGDDLCTGTTVQIVCYGTAVIIESEG